MKKIFVKFFLVVLYTATVSVADAAISRVIPTKTGNENTETEKTVSPVTVNRATSSRNVSRARHVENLSSKNATVSRSVNTRKVGERASLSDAVNTVGRSARTEAASINANPAVRRAGLVLRASTAEVGGRATIGNTGIQTGSNIDEQVRGIQSRASIFGSNKQKPVTAESLAAAKDVLEKTSDLNNTCQQQYNECMDQFCAVVDTNQKRCSCSSNLAKYAKAQEAVENANAELNDIAQQIRYVGLSADEIHAIMSATEAELAMTKTKDSTKNRSMLDDIVDMIKDPTASIDLYGSSTDSLLDLDLDFSSDSTDLFGLDLFNTNNDISLKRGTALYNEAKKRCKTVLSRCKDAGGAENQISGNYDLLIAKDCAAYEQGLEKLNEKLKTNVRSANLMLQKARLAVLQNKNEYDARECVGALEKCMLDDMVCGDDYVKCVDPTKVYIDENGEVVLGRNLANITAIMQNYDNTNINRDFIKNAINTKDCSKADGSCIVNYLMTKIGTGQTFKEGGLCRPVLDKCQYYTYEKSGKNSTYVPYNEIVVSYIQRAMVNIKAAQARIISEYASKCFSDVGECYNQQNTQINSWYSAFNVDNIYHVLKGTCYNVALTCGYTVFAYDLEMGHRIDNVTNSYYCEKNPTSCTAEGVPNANSTPVWTAEQQKELDLRQKDALIYGISEMFYQSLLCPDYSSFNAVMKQNATNPDSYINDRCKCNDGYYAYGATCVSTCPSGTFLQNGACKTSRPDDCLLDGNACVTACSESAPYTYNGNCVASCPTENPYLYNNTCVESCPAGTFPDNINHKCEICDNDTHIHYDDDTTIYECVLDCSLNTTDGKTKLDFDINTCVASCSNEQYAYGDICYNQCPVDTYGCNDNNTLTCVMDCSSNCGSMITPNDTTHTCE